MIEAFTKTRFGAFTPVNNDESNGEIIGRCNALHDWVMEVALERSSASSFYSDPLDDKLKTVCFLMGFADVLEITKEKTEAPEEKEKADAANTD